ncbi:MAG: DNA polymerase III subunit gamma/tau [SAR202 cluster bacterium]|nr:DNA polymerase III subunit gamma/tau [SAR202 cluster bacterium]
MSEVLYRKWRPRRLDELVGQEPVTQTLTRAVALGRVAHAYLFCGPRGTGKTSTARILAKSVNCLASKDGEADDSCGICRSINEGRALDLVEIDAASNRGIDDIRTLRDKVHFTPNEARYKVYIVDEVHMLSDAAFNALLKTLEEPPPHAIFVLATTEAHKIPATIISRCQRFDFRRISTGAVVDRLQAICAGEGFEAETAALELIARTSAGGLRDAINLLEQAVVSYGSPVTERHVRDLLGLGSDEAALTLTGHVLNRSPQDGLKLINDVLAQGSDVRQLHRTTVDLLRLALLLKSDAGVTSGYPKETVERVHSYVSGTTLAHVVHALKCFARVDMRRDTILAMPLELATVESALGEDKPQAPAKPAPTGRAPSRPTNPTPQYSRPPQYTSPQWPSSPPPSRPVAAQPAAPATPAPSASIPLPTDLPADPSARLDRQWEFVLKVLSRHNKWRRFNVGALLRGCDQRQVADGVITLRFAHKSHVERIEEELDNPESRKLVLDALAQAMQSKYDVRVEAVEAAASASPQQAARTSNLVRMAQAMGAQVVAEKEEPFEPEADPPGAGTPKTDA